MTILQFSIKIIKEIRTWPLNAKKRPYSGGPKTCWDEFKELYWKDGSYYHIEIREAFRKVVTQKVTALTEEDFNELYFANLNNNFTTNIQDRIRDLIDSTLDQIMWLCRIQKILYNKPVIKYVRYYVDSDPSIAEIVDQFEEDLYNVIEYTKQHIEPGLKDYLNLKHLTEENGLEVISSEEFEFEKNKLLSGIYSKPQKVESIPEIEKPKTMTARTALGIIAAIKEAREKEKLMDNQATNNPNTD